MREREQEPDPERVAVEGAVARSASLTGTRIWPMVARPKVSSVIWVPFAWSSVRTTEIDRVNGVAALTNRHRPDALAAHLDGSWRPHHPDCSAVRGIRSPPGPRPRRTIRHAHAAGCPRPARGAGRRRLQHRPRRPSRARGGRWSDLVILPEYVPYRGTADGWRASARPVPGPTTDPFAVGGAGDRVLDPRRDPRRGVRRSAPPVQHGRRHRPVRRDRRALSQGPPVRRRRGGRAADHGVREGDRRATGWWP